MGWLGQTHWRILFALGLGLVWGVVATFAGLSGFTGDWIAPFGTIFLRLLLLIAVPLVLASLVTGVASLANLQKLSRIGGKTIAIYLGTTLVALVIGLVVVNVVEPGTSIPESLRLSLQEAYQGDVAERQATAEQMERGPLQPLVDMVPDNIFNAASNNRSMLSVVFTALLLGVALMLLPREQAQPLLSLFESVNAAIIKIVEIILVVAPVGVFSLIAGTITSVAGDNPSDVAQLLGALGLYCLCVLVGLAIHAFLTYPILLRTLTPITPFRFLRGVVPAQLVAFSTSSSAATLPVSMETAEHNLGVSEEVTSFVLPLGATINMDGTARLHVGGGRLHRADARHPARPGGAGNHRLYRAPRLDRHRGGAQRRNRDAGHRPRGHRRAGGRHRADLRRRPDPRHVPDDDQRDRRRHGGRRRGLERRAVDGDGDKRSGGTDGERRVMTPTRDDVWALLTEYTQSESLRKHALAVEAAMRGYARRFGEDEEAWGIVGLVHDFDYERWPDATDHPFRGRDILRERGWPDYMIRAILSHADYSGVPRESRLEHTLFACDELAGFITAAALVRPTKSILDLQTKSVKKRMKDKAFARAVSRDDLRQGAEELELPLDEHITNVIGFMREVADDLGLRGTV